MVNNKIPFRCNLILALAKEPEGLTPVQLYEKMKDAYRGERQCTVKSIDSQLMSIKSVGLVEIKETMVDENDQLLSTYRITDYGAERTKKYIGKYM